MSASRRQFVGGLIATSGAMVVSSRALAAKEPLPETDPLAIALGYKADAGDVDPAAYPKRSGAEGAKQFCYNCALYKGPAAGYGDCTAIPRHQVAGQGWCNAWIPVRSG